MPLFCCAQQQADWSEGDPYELFKLLTADAFSTRGLCDGLIDYKLDGRILQGGPDWQMAKALIDRHHRHHPPPVGWKYGAGVWNGPTLVGVATVGRPVARMLPQQTWVEVNRSCTVDLGGLERHAASKLYAICTQEAKRRGYERIITYTYVNESGVSIKAAWGKEALDGFVKGQSWSRTSRPRRDKSEIKDKHRWAKQLRQSTTRNSSKSS